MATNNAAHPFPAAPPVIEPEADSLVASLLILLRFVTVMVVLLAVASFPRSSFFRVTDVMVSGHRQVPAGDLIAYARIQPGEPLFAVSAVEAAGRVAQHPRIAAARVTLQLSGQVLVAVTERRARAAVPYRDTFLIVDAAGVVIDALNDPGPLPLLQIAGLSLPWVRLGDQLPAPQVGQALQVLRLLPQAVRLDGIEIRMDRDEEFTVVTADGVPVLLGPLRGLDDRAAMLPDILSAIQRQKIAVRYLDLRFSGNVVVRPERNQGAGVGP